MKIIVWILACVMILCSFVGCVGNEKTMVPTNVTDSGYTDIEEPEIEYIDVYFDDRISLNVLANTYIESYGIRDQVVTSSVTGSNEPDENVIIVEEETYRMIAVGTGTAVLTVNGNDYHIRVNPAPITLAIIVGSSSAYGTGGNKDQTILCESGQVYNTHLLISSEKWNLDWRDDFIGSTLGYAEEDRVINIDMLTKDAGKEKGFKGLDSGFAYEWNNLTGDKVWVLNCGVGGSCINEWQPDAKENWGRFSVEAMNMAARILKNEVAAGHYDFKSMVMINYNGGNFDYRNVKYDDEALIKWHDSLWNMFINGATEDIDGDGVVDVPEHLGYVPSWSDERTEFITDVPLSYYRAASAEYSHVFLACDFRRLLRTDRDVKYKFPHYEYKMRVSGKVPQPTTISEVFVDDSRHMSQIAHNAVGIQTARNLYWHMTGEGVIKNVYLYDITSDATGVEIGDEMTMKNGEARKLVFISDPLGISDFDITVEGPLTLDGIFCVTATAKGEGRLVIKRDGEEIKTVRILID